MDTSKKIPLPMFLGIQLSLFWCDFFDFLEKNGVKKIYVDPQLFATVTWEKDRAFPHGTYLFACE